MKDWAAAGFKWAGSEDKDDSSGTARFAYGINHLSRPMLCVSFRYATEIQALIDHSYAWGMQKGAQEAMRAARDAMENFERKLPTPGPIYE